MSRSEVSKLYAEAALIINYHGGTVPLPEHYATGRLVYLETDPVELQIELFNKDANTIAFLEPHCAFFTWGLNYYSPDCRLPLPERFHFKTSVPAVVQDLWSPNGGGPRELLTTIGNWRQVHRKVEFLGEIYHWNKEYEFQKIITLPSRTPQKFELALSSYTDADQAMLEEKGWLIRSGLAISGDVDAYRNFIAQSRGEFTVAKDQNIRLRTGWFSERSAQYLAAGRPVITQETGFCNVMPTGCGLFGFSTMDDILAAVENINGDYEKNCRAAQEIACDYFNYDVVLGKMLRDLGIAPRVPPPRPPHAFPSRLPLTPLSRRPIRLPEVTTRTVLGRHVPAFVPRDDPAVPRASIIVATHDNLVFTRMSLESVLADTDYKNFEVIVVDNASTDGTPEYLRTLAAQNPQVRAIFNTENLGFAKANNQGLAAATGEFLILLNNDTIVPPGWLGRLLRHLDDPAVGLVGPVTNRIGNAAEIPAGYETYGEFLEFAAGRAAAHAGGSREIRMPAMFCLAMRRDAFEKIGPLDEQFEIGMFEDDDYAMRTRKAGLRIACAEDVFVHHFGEASLGELYPSGKHSDVFNANRARFEKKWGTEWDGPGSREKIGDRDIAAAVRAAMLAHTPPGASVLVLSKGDPALVDVGDRRAAHFPQSPSGGYAGHHPADGAAALAQLDALRARGAEFLLIPRTSWWWLQHYAEFAKFLEGRCILHARDGNACAVFDLRDAGPAMNIALIVGCERSGTTILGELLAAHLAVRFIFEPHEIWERAGDGINGSHRLVAEHATTDVRLSIREWFRGQQGAATLLVDKTPRNVLRIPYVRAIFPEAKIIHIVRDGRDTACSLVPGMGGDPWIHLKPPTWRELQAQHSGVARCALAWREIMQIALDDLAGVPHLQIRYEDLIADHRLSRARC